MFPEGKQSAEIYITQAQVMSDLLISSISFPNMERTNIRLKAHLMSLLVLQSLMISCIDMSGHTFECSQTKEKQLGCAQEIAAAAAPTSTPDHISGPYLLTSCHNGALLCKDISAFLHQKNKIKTQSFQHSTNRHLDEGSDIHFILSLTMTPCCFNWLSI